MAETRAHVAKQPIDATGRRSAHYQQ